MIIATTAIGASAIGAEGNVPDIQGTAVSAGRSFTQSSIGTKSSDVITGVATSAAPNFSQSTVGNVIGNIEGVATSIGKTFNSIGTGTISIDNIEGTAVSTAPAFTQNIAGAVKKHHFGTIASTGRGFRVRLKGYGGPLSGLPQDIVLNDGCHSTNIIQIHSANITGELTMKVQELEAQYACQ